MARRTAGEASARGRMVEGVLNSPVAFAAARVPEKTALRPSSYVVFRAQGAGGALGAHGGHVAADANGRGLPGARERLVRAKAKDHPKTLASAVLKYTGKKYGVAKDRRDRGDRGDRGDRVDGAGRERGNAKDRKARLRAMLLQSNGVVEEEELSQEEFVDAQDHFDEADQDGENKGGEGEAAASASASTSESTSDAEFDNDAALQSTNSESERESERESENESENESASDEESPSGVEIKRDLKDELKQSHLQAPAPGSLPPKETPPTSPEEDVMQGQLLDTKFARNQFYDLNEVPDNKGSNGSTRISKSWNKFAQGHSSLGLLNHGVTCYMNSAVQALFHIPSLCHYLSEVHTGAHPEIKADSVSAVLASTMFKMYRVGHERKLMHINPKKLISRLEDINCMMSQWQQEDSHEYLMSLMSRLQEDSTPKGVKLNQSIIYDIFGGLLDQSVTCKNCGHISTTQQEFYDLSLTLDNRKKTSLMIEPEDLFKLRNQIESCKSSKKESKVQLSDLLKQKILAAQEQRKSQTPEPKDSDSDSDTTHAKTYSIQNSIKDFFTPEVLKSGYICELCKQTTNAIKISTIARSPETLFIHLKRFRFNGQQSQKVKANVTYPEYLDLAEYTTTMTSPATYKLTSVIVHQGRSVSSGHYIAHCRQMDGTWATYDDEYVNKIRSTAALSDPGAYVLVYERLTHKDVAAAAAPAAASAATKRSRGGSPQRKKRRRN